MALVANTYTNYLLDRDRRAAEFAALGRLLARVPVRRVVPHVDAARLPRLCDIILADCPARPPALGPGRGWEGACTAWPATAT
jgi:hypothetical protein